MARAILEYYQKSGQKDAVYPISNSQIVDGRGIKATVNGQSVLVGNERLLKEAGIAANTSQLSATSSHVLLAVNEELRLALEVSDQLRDGVKDALHDLRKLKDYQLVLLSGDNQAVAEKQ